MRLGNCIYWQTEHSWQEVWTEGHRMAVESNLHILFLQGKLGGISIEYPSGSIKHLWFRWVHIHERPDTISETEADKDN